MTNLAIDQSKFNHTSETEPGSLSDAMSLVNEALACADEAAVGVAMVALEKARPDAKLKHVQLHEAGRLAMTAKHWDCAERFAIRSLVAFPKYGDSFKLLGDVLTRKRREEEATLCYRFQIPAAIEEQYLSEPPVEYVKTCSDAGSILRHKAFDAEVIAVNPPIQFNPTSLPEFSYTELNAAEAFVAAVPGGELWYDGGQEIVWDRNGRVIEDISLGQPSLVQASAQGRKPVYLEGKVCLLGNRSYMNYYHWLYDTLPRLSVLENAGIDIDTIDLFVVMPLRHPFHTESLERLGISSDRLHTVDKGEYISADELYIPHFGSNSLGLAQARWNPEYLRKKFGPSVPAEQQERRLFISRGNTGKRGISNEPKLIDALLPLGFEVVHCENLSMVEQAQMFAEASVVLGPHGAGLTNIVYCQPGTTVIELFNAHIAPCFWSISELMELKHITHFCGHVDDKAELIGTMPPRTSEAFNSRRHAFDVDVADVLNTLHELQIH